MDSVAFVFLAAALLEKQKICAWEELKIDSREMYSSLLNVELENVPHDAKSGREHCEFRLSPRHARKYLMEPIKNSDTTRMAQGPVHWHFSQFFRCSHAVKP